MRVTPLELPDVLLIEPRVVHDARGSFHEGWSGARFAQMGITEPFVQDNVSRSRHRVLRGLHLQHPQGQGKLVSALHGEIYDVAVDVRVGSPTFGRWCGERLGAATGRQLYVPVGFAHGFVVLGDEAVVLYKVTERYHPEAEITVAWDDPAIGIDWPVDGRPVLSDRDAGAPRLAELRDRLPTFDGAAMKRVDARKASA